MQNKDLLTHLDVQKDFSLSASLVSETLDE